MGVKASVFYIYVLTKRFQCPVFTLVYRNDATRQRQSNNAGGGRTSLNLFGGDAGTGSFQQGRSSRFNETEYPDVTTAAAAAARDGGNLNAAPQWTTVKPVTAATTSHGRVNTNGRANRNDSSVAASMRWSGSDDQVHTYIHT